MKIRTLCLLLGVYLSLLNMAFSQTTEEEEETVNDPVKRNYVIYVGPTVGYTKSYHTFERNSFANSPAEDPCPTFNNGNDNGYHFGLNVLYPFALRDSKHALIFRFLYNTYPSFTTTQSATSNLPSLVDVTGGDESALINTSTEHTLKADYKTISMDIMYAFKPFPKYGVVFTVGPTFDFAIKKTLTQQLKLITDNPNVRFKPQNSDEYTYEDPLTLNIGGKDKDIDNSSAFRFGFKGGVHYEFTEIEKVVIAPYIMYNLGVTELSSTGSWRVNALMIGADIRFALQMPRWLRI